MAFALGACVDVHLRPGAGGTGGDVSTGGTTGAAGDTGAGGDIGAGGVTGTGGTGTGGHGAGGTGAGGTGTGGIGMGGTGAGGMGMGGSRMDAGTDVSEAGYDGPVFPMPGVGDLVINEIMYDTAAAPSDDLGEWFEVYNPSADRSFDLFECAFFDSSANNVDQIHTHLIIEPQKYLTFARSMPGFAASFTYTSVKFSDAGDLLRFTCASGQVDVVDFHGFPLMQGFSLSLDPRHANTVDNDLASSWCRATTFYETTTRGTDFGSPNVMNPQCP
jgi:hypothetical protein